MQFFNFGPRINNKSNPESDLGLSFIKKKIAKFSQNSNT